MMATENMVYSVAMRFTGYFKDSTPEAVIFGYAKLLSMDGRQISSLIPEEYMEEVESASLWFMDKGLDINLIKSGLLMIIPLIKLTESDREKYDSFSAFLESEEDDDVTSTTILKAALRTAYVPFEKVFKKGNDITSVFEYHDSLKALKEAFEKEEEKKKQEKKAPKEDATEEEDDAFEEEDDSLIKDSIFEDDDDDDEGESPASNNDVKDHPDLYDLSEKYRRLGAALFDVVKGQDNAVIKFIKGFNQGELLKNTEKGNCPRAYYFFFGPPGVGKTLLARTAADSLGLPYKIYNMSEYSGPQSHEDLIGISSIYKSAKEGTLVKFVRENPECLLVFDEIEKANINVIRQFLQILGAGTLHNVYLDSEVSFTAATIIFTSNVGRQLYEDRSVNLTTLPEKVLIDAIQKETNGLGGPALPPEICSRIASGNTIMFNHISIRHLSDMVKRSFDRVVIGMSAEYGITVSYSPLLPLLFLFNRGGDIDARVATLQSGRFLKDELYELLRHLEKKPGENNNIKYVDIDIDWRGMDKELMSLFKSPEKSEILVFANGSEDVFSSVDSDKYSITFASTIEEAHEAMQKDISAVFIDPFSGGESETDEAALSIADYNTDGVRLFYELTEKQTSLPIFLLEVEGQFSEVDRRTFLQEGAAGSITANKSQPANFAGQVSQLIDELYMEKESQTFCQRGFIIDFKARQEIVPGEEKIRIVFYGIKKRIAVDLESRGSILSDAERPNVLFKDVIGAKKAKEELQYFANYLKNPKRFLMNGGKPPRGILLYGPPGTGKTMLARAMAGECDVHFLQTSAAEFKNKYLGESEANIRRLFQRAKKYAPAIIFIDEIDAIGKKRTGSAGATESMLNTLLTEMDGFSSMDSTKPVFVLAATNYGAGAEYDGISSLDDALIRRFDNQIYVDLPNESERKEFLIKQLSAKMRENFDESIAENIAQRTTGQSLAILQNVIELAFRNATKQERAMTGQDILTALEEYIYGEKKEHTPEYYRSVAIHEIGHAYVSYISGDKPSYITIESRANFGGYMQHSNQEDVPSYTREELLARIRASLAGRAAEEVFFGREQSLNTGASSDLKTATYYAFNIICRFGMENDQLVVLSRDEILGSPVAESYISKVNDILVAQMKLTVEMIEKNKGKIEKLAEALIRENRLTGAQFEELMNET